MPSEKILKLKKEIVQELSDKLKSAKAVVFADYRGLTVEQDTELRNALRKAGVEYSVVKNTMTRFAAKENGLEELDSVLKGPTSMAFSATDSIAPAKVMYEYAKKYEKLELKIGVYEGKVVDINTVNALGQLPPRDVLIAQVLGTMIAPIGAFARVINSIKEQKEQVEA